MWISCNDKLGLLNSLSKATKDNITFETPDQEKI